MATDKTTLVSYVARWAKTGNTLRPISETGLSRTLRDDRFEEEAL